MSSGSPDGDRATADVSVRPARASDAAAMAEVQLETWRALYADVLPAPVLDGLSAAEVEASWQEAVTAPPSALHAVFVALHAGRLVGFAAAGPANSDAVGSDEPTHGDGELLELLVGPGFQQAGHASRLLAAVVDHLETSGSTHIVTWRLAGDDAARRFFTSAGWAPDGARRTLDADGEPVEQIRLHTSIGVSVTALR